MNKIFLIGNVGSDPEFKQTQSSQLVSFSLAVNEYQKKGEEYEKKTNWFKVVHFGKGAEFSRKHVKKGMKIHVEGRIEVSTYSGPDGIQKTSVSVIAENINIFEKIEKHEDAFPY
jgi:single-strand DNA-binding protein